MNRIAIADLQHFVMECLLSTGLNDADCRTTSEALVSTDALGVFTHGSKLLVGYLKKLRGGGYPIEAVPQIDREGPAWAIVDGAAGLGQVGSTFALQTAIKKAKQYGVAFVSLRNTGHIGAAGHYAVQAAKAGCLAMVTGNDMPSVAAPGSTKAVLGSNPLAYAIPTGGDPILLDIATAAVAGGKVYAALQRGEQIPPTWLIGPDGLPTTDGSLYPYNAALAPMAGHKGYGMGLWCEVLSALIPGGAMTWQVGSWLFDAPSKPSLHNASFFVADIDAMTDRDQFNGRMQKLIDEIHAAPTAAGIASVLLPGEREFHNARNAAQHGIDLPEDVRMKLRECAEFVGCAVPAFLQ
ncbi:MAG: Ldh family oxidoreductase [Planctomycetaceae bacterium]